MIYDLVHSLGVDCDENKSTIDLSVWAEKIKKQASILLDDNVLNCYNGKQEDVVWCSTEGRKKYHKMTPVRIVFSGKNVVVEMA